MNIRSSEVTLAKCSLLPFWKVYSEKKVFATLKSMFFFIIDPFTEGSCSVRSRTSQTVYPLMEMEGNLQAHSVPVR